MAIPFEDCYNSGTSASTTVYCISNLTFFKCGPTSIHASDTKNKIHKDLSSSYSEKQVPGCRIKVRKGIFTSLRAITSDDIRIVAEIVQDDWKKLLKKLPGVTLNDLSFHQAFIDAMDRRDSSNMAEITLFTWKEVHPEFSTIGNLSKTLFSIDHPDIVALLKP